jgi:hypothetical protein
MDQALRIGRTILEQQIDHCSSLQPDLGLALRARRPCPTASPSSRDRAAVVAIQTRRLAWIASLPSAVRDDDTWHDGTFCGCRR